MHSYRLDSYTVEFALNWVQGTQTGNDPIEPIYGLTFKYRLVTTTNNSEDFQFYDENGHANFSDAFTQSEHPYELTSLAQVRPP